MSMLLVAVRSMTRFTAGAVFLCWVGSAAAQTVAVVTDGTPDAPARYGLAKLEDALRARGFTVGRELERAELGADNANLMI
jgi:hypothetical protein